ncbi:MAG: hypothetical protein ABS78_19975 [Phenylobacterium sp. SCN 70-31]|jgi:hypothetical protein|nr:MAG: hypothetical protein ABS78_19975 [Phenylobacterium sp. SCN 70-31]
MASSRDVKVGNLVNFVNLRFVPARTRDLSPFREADAWRPRRPYVFVARVPAGRGLSRWLIWAKPIRTFNADPPAFFP